MDNLLVTASPHVRDRDTVPKVMWSVVVALVPATVFGVFYFGWYAAAIVATAVVSSCATEALILKLRRRPITLGDGSAVVTGLLLALVLPVTVPLVVPIIGSVVAIAVAKQLFGGLGYNVWNPALVGRAFVHIAYAGWMNNSFVELKATGLGRLLTYAGRAADGNMVADAVTKATPLATSVLEAAYQTGGGAAHAAYSYWDLFVGTIPGCIGETSALLLMLGGLFLIARKCVNWRVPVFYVATTALLNWLLPFNKEGVALWGFAGGDALYQALAGGLMLGAFFMATDMVTTPLTNRGLIIFAVGCGLITGIIRLYGGFPEGVCYSILIMNTATPLIDRLTRNRVLGVK